MIFWIEVSKKRKTKSQKIIASERREKEKSSLEILTKTYSIPKSDVQEIKINKESNTNDSLDQVNSIPQNIKKILIASGLIFGLNIILFIVLQVTPTKLGILGY